MNNYDDDNSFLQVYLGEQYVNNVTLSDVTFLVEGLKMIYFHIILPTSSCITCFGESNVLATMKILLA